MLSGDPDLKATDLNAYELGYRARVTDELTLDTAAFYFDYDSVISIPSKGVGAFNNAGEAESYGIEFAATLKPTDAFQATASYHFVKLQIHGPVMQGSEGVTPEHQFQLRSSLDITHDLTLNSALYYVDNASVHDAQAYIRLDLGMSWRPSENFELTVWGQNLLDPSHLESDDSFTQSAPTEVERGVYVQTTIRF